MPNDRANEQKQPVTLTWESDQFQVITFDATVSETHTSTANITSHPIEEGADGSDNIQRMPDELSLSVVVTDYPIVKDKRPDGTPANPTPASTGGSASQRANSAYDFLRRTKDRGKLVAVFTTLRPYKNMAIGSITVTRDKDTSRIISAHVTLKEIIVSTTEQVEAPTPSPTEAAPARNRKSKLGKKQKAKEAEANKKKARSGLAKIADGTGAQSFFNSLGAP